MFIKSSLEQLKQRIDLVELISRYLPSLKRSGSVYKALCPFHEEQTPSFQVKAGEQYYHCFGCGAHGDAFSFLAHHEGLSFIESVKWLAERYGIVVEQSEDSGQDHRVLLELMRQAQLFLVWALWQTPEGESARSYLASRNMDTEFGMRYGIGYCPSPNQGLEMRRYLKSLGYTQAQLQEVGLVGSSGKDFFAGRITFPIFDYRGQPIAFSARSYNAHLQGPKYVNSPETPLFKKSRTLFGFHYSRARMAKQGMVLLVEGQIDSLKMIDAGWNLTVAPLGTALGKDHIGQLLKVGVNHAWLLLDGDKAGQAAAVKSGQLLMQEGIDVHVATLPNGQDPDSLLRQGTKEQGVRVIQELIERSTGYIDFLVGHYAQEVDLSAPGAKNSLAIRLKSQIEAWQRPVMVYAGLQALARALCVPEALLIDSSGRPFSEPPPATSSPPSSTLTPLLGVQADCLRWLLLAGQSKVVEYCLHYLEEDDFSHPPFKALWQTLQDRHQHGMPTLSFSQAALELDSSLSVCVQELGDKRLNLSKLSTGLQQTVERLLASRTMRKLERLRLMIHSGQLSDEEAMSKAAEYASLKKQRVEVMPLEGFLAKS